jgi:hypothetical protein
MHQVLPVHRRRRFALTAWFQQAPMDVQTRQSQSVGYTEVSTVCQASPSAPWQPT